MPSCGVECVNAWLCNTARDATLHTVKRLLDDDRELAHVKFTGRRDGRLLSVEISRYQSRWTREARRSIKLN